MNRRPHAGVLSLVLSLEYFKLGHEGDVLRHMTWLCEVG